jgi:Glycine rich protein
MKRALRFSLALSLLLGIITPFTAHAVSANPTPDCTAGTTCTITFSYTGDYYSWTVPNGVTSITVDASGASGGANWSTGVSPGKGGRVQATVTTTPGTSLYMYVGGTGTQARLTGNSTTGGWNGGGLGGSGNGNDPNCYCGTGGGGATDIRTTAGSLSSRILVAGGGGGSGTNYTTSLDNGGDAGGLTGSASTGTASGSTTAGGGTQSAGGGANTWSGWNTSYAGSSGVGGNSGTGTGGGGGGGGYFGGGGGSWTGGGGGSSYTNASYASAVTHSAGYRSGNGTLSITYLNSPTATTFSTSQSTPTNIATSGTISYSLILSQSVSDLTASDFQFGGASSCNTPGLSGSGTTYTVTVTNCTGGTLILQLKANSVTGTSAGPASVASANTIVIDRVAPTFSAVASYPVGNFYPGNTLNFNFLMSESVTVSGTPRLALTIGAVTRYANYSSGSNSNNLVFSYTIATDINEIDLDSIAMSSPIDPNGGSITDLASNAMSVFSYTPPTLSIYVAQPPSAPTISSITPSNAQLSVAFTAGASNGASISKYQYSTDDGSSWKDRASGTTASPLVITTVSSSTAAIVNGTSYKVRLRGVSLAGNGDSATAVTAAPSIVVITGDSTLVTTYGQSGSTTTYTSSGGTSPYTYTLSSTPSGVSISAGVVTASGATAAGTYTQNVVSTDSASQTGLKSLTITVNKAATSISISLPNSASTAALGGAVTITATVPRAGQVNFKLGGTTITGCGTATAASTTATCSWTPGTLGGVSLTAVFTPTDSSNYETSTSTTLSITVVNGTSSVTLSLTGGVTQAVKGNTINIIAAVDQAGKLTILIDGKRLVGCFNISVSVGNKSCVWKPAVQKQVNISATLTPTNSVYNSSNAKLSAQVVRRSGTR